MQYSKQFTDALQFMWGQGFLSPGGPEEVDEMLRGIDVEGKRVLDIGSGLGGIDVLLASRYGAAEVVGIDVEAQLVEAARELVRREGVAAQVRYELVEPGALPFPAETFDIVFSKDALVHIADKALMYREVLRVLRRGGVFVAADWLWREGSANSAVVQAWLSKGPLSFAFTTPAEAEEALRSAGFAEIRIVDQRLALQASNRREVEALAGEAGERMAEALGEAVAAQRLYSARGRQGALDSGDLIPSHMFGRKPA